MRVTVDLPLKIVSVANLREGWRARAKRAKLHRQAAYYQLAAAHAAPAAGVPVVVTLTRIAPRRLDADDNLRHAFKAAKDGVADWLRRDDADASITWNYVQQRGAPKFYAARVEVST